MCTNDNRIHLKTSQHYHQQISLKLMRVETSWDKLLIKTVLTAAPLKAADFCTEREPYYTLQIDEPDYLSVAVQLFIPEIDKTSLEWCHTIQINRKYQRSSNKDSFLCVLIKSRRFNFRISTNSLTLFYWWQVWKL